MTDLKDTRTEAELIKATQTLVQSSYEVVGMDKTINSLEFLNGLITENPAMYKKLTDPVTVTKLQELAGKMKGKKNFGIVDAIGLAPEFKKIFE